MDSFPGPAPRTTAAPADAHPGSAAHSRSAHSRPAVSSSAAARLRSTRRVAALAAVVAAAALPLLTGCSVIQAVRPQDGTTFDQYSSASSRWAADPDIPTWIPSDSADVRVRTSADRDTAIVRVTTSSPADAGCTAAADAELPALEASWSPTALGSELLTCGTWTVMAVDGGLFGWRTTPDEVPTTQAAG